MSEQVWHEPVDGFEFSTGEVIVDADYQREKLQACGLPADRLNNFVDASFYIGIGIRHGIEMALVLRAMSTWCSVWCNTNRSNWASY